MLISIPRYEDPAAREGKLPNIGSFPYTTTARILRRQDCGYVYTAEAGAEVPCRDRDTESWAEQVLKDKRYDSKLFSKTRLILVDVAETVDRYRRIFQKIKTNTDIAKVLSLKEELDKLKQEENVPEELESEETVAVMRLSEGERLRAAYVDNTYKIEADLKTAEKNQQSI